MGTGSERGFILFINRLQQLIASFFLNGFLLLCFFFIFFLLIHLLIKPISKTAVRYTIF